MEYGINVNYFAKKIGIQKASELVAKAGFTKLDYTPPVQDENWKADMKEAMQIFESNGLSVHQTHAPFNRYGRYGNQHSLCLDRCAEATEFMGAKFMVTHGDEFDFEHFTFSPEAALDYNHRLFLPYVARAEKSSYKLAFETVFEDWDRRRYTSAAEELKNLILSFDSAHAVCCWDFGHANVAFRKKQADVVKSFGTLIQCTHLHDNAGNDSHQLPMTGDINWEAVIRAFKEFGYSGVMSVEYSHGNMAEHLMGDFINLTYQTAKYLWSL